MNESRSGHTLGSSALIYTLSLVITPAVAILTAPILIRKLGSSNFAIWDILNAGISLIASVYTAGIDIGAIRLFFDADDSHEQQMIFSTGFLFVMLLTVLTSVLILVLSPQLTHLILKSTHQLRPLVMATISIPLTVGASYTREAFRAKQKPWHYFHSVALTSILSAVISVLLVVQTNLGVTGVFIGTIVGSLSSLLYNFVRAYDLLRPRFSLQKFKELLSYSLPYLPAGLSGWSLGVVDRFVLVNFVSFSQIGQYAVANRVSNLMLLVIYGFGAAWSPFVFSLHKDNQEAARSARGGSLRNALAAMAMLAILLSAFAPEILQVLGGSHYLAAARLVPPLTAGLLLFGSIQVTQTAMLIEKRTGLLAIHAVIAAIVNLIACLIFVPMYGNEGAVIAAALGYAYEAISYLITSQKISHAKFDYKGVSFVLGLFGGAIALLTIFETKNAHGYLVHRTLSAILFIVVVFATKLFDYRLLGKKGLSTVN